MAKEREWHNSHRCLAARSGKGAAWMDQEVQHAGSSKRIGAGAGILGGLTGLPRFHMARGGNRLSDYIKEYFQKTGVSVTQDRH